MRTFKCYEKMIKNFKTIIAPRIASLPPFPSRHRDDDVGRVVVDVRVVVLVVVGVGADPVQIVVVVVDVVVHVDN